VWFSNLSGFVDIQHLALLCFGWKTESKPFVLVHHTTRKGGRKNINFSGRAYQKITLVQTSSWPYLILEHIVTYNSNAEFLLSLPGAVNAFKSLFRELYLKKFYCVLHYEVQTVSLRQVFFSPFLCKNEAMSVEIHALWFHYHIIFAFYCTILNYKSPLLGCLLFQQSFWITFVRQTYQRSMNILAVTLGEHLSSTVHWSICQCSFVMLSIKHKVTPSIIFHI